MRNIYLKILRRYIYKHQALHNHVYLRGFGSSIAQYTAANRVMNNNDLKDAIFSEIN